MSWSAVWGRQGYRNARHVAASGYSDKSPLEKRPAGAAPRRLIFTQSPLRWPQA